MSNTSLRSESLDLLRFPLAIIIVIVHTFALHVIEFQGIQLHMKNMPMLLEINYLIGGFLLGQSVPIYFFISGYVFFLGGELTKEKYIHKLKNRMKSLLIPYLIWNGIAIMIVFLKRLSIFSSIQLESHNTLLNYDLPAILGCFWDASKGIFPSETLCNIYPQNVPLWFLRDLMIVVLCTPILYWLLKKTRYYIVFILGVLWFFSDSLAIVHFEQLITAFLFFTWGAYMSVNNKDMLKEFGRFFNYSMLLYPILALLYVYLIHHYPELSHIIKKLNIIVGLFFAYNLSTWLLTHHICRVNSFLASSSFFIYLSHTFICGNSMKLIMVIFRPRTELSVFLIQTMSVVITVSLLLFAFYILRRYAPSFLKVIIGRK